MLTNVHKRFWANHIFFFFKLYIYQVICSQNSRLLSDKCCNELHLITVDLICLKLRAAVQENKGAKLNAIFYIFRSYYNILEQISEMMCKICAIYLTVAWVGDTARSTGGSPGGRSCPLLIVYSLASRCQLCSVPYRRRNSKRFAWWVTHTIITGTIMCKINVANRLILTWIPICDSPTDVRSIPFHAGELVTTESASQNQGLSVLESLAIGVCVLLLIFVYAAGIIFYVHYKQRQKRKEKDPEQNHSNTMSTDNGSLESRIDMSNVVRNILRYLIKRICNFDWAFY